MKLNWILVVVLAVALVGYSAVSSRNTSVQINDLKQRLTETYAITLELERKLGYGGLIHNLKNYILRASEDKYYTPGKRNISDIIALLDKLERNAAALDLDAHFPETRKMLSAYLNRFDVAKEMIATGMSPKDIDGRILFDDGPALQEINAYVNLVSADIRQRSDTLEEYGRRLNLIVSLMVGGAVFGGVYIQHANRQTRKIRLLNNELIDSNHRLSHLNDALRQFAGVASHDLKTPIRHINYFTELTKEDSDKPEKVREHADLVLASANRMQMLIESLLEYTRSTYTAPDKRKIKTQELVSDVVEELQHEIDALGGEVEIGPLPDIYADYNLIRQVFQNLIGNSLKYAKEDCVPHIVISAETHSHEMVFSVQDNGIGVNPEHAEKIFEPMQRLHSQKSKYGGVGIGLALINSIIEGHGGTVWLDKTYRGGAKMMFTIPREDARNDDRQ